MNLISNPQIQRNSHHHNNNAVLLRFSFSLLASFLLSATSDELFADGPKDNPNIRRPRVVTEIVATQTDELLSIALSADGSLIVGGGFGKRVRIWDTKTNEQRYVFEVPQGAVRAVAFHPKDDLIAGAVGTDVCCWDLKTKSLLNKLSCLPGVVGWLAFSPDGKMLAGSATEFRDGKPQARILVWDFETGKLLFRSDSGPVLGRCVAFSSDGKWMAAPHFKITKQPVSSPIKDFEREDGVQIWSTETWQQSKLLLNERGGTYTVDFSPNGKLIAGSGGYFPDEPKEAAYTPMRGQVVIWDFESGEVKQRIKRKERAGSVHTRFSPDGKLIAGQHYGRVFQDGNGESVLSEITLWDVATGDHLWTVVDEFAPDPQPPVFSPDGKYLYCRDQKALRKLDVSSGDLVGNIVEAAPIKN